MGLGAAMWRSRRKAVVAAAGLALAAAGVAGAAPAAASFLRASSTTLDVSTATLAPATGLAAGEGLCIKNKSLPTVVLTWTPTTSAFATGYEIARDGTVIATVAGPLSATYTDAMVAPSTTYSYSVRAVRNYWRSPWAAPAQVTTPSKQCR